MILTNEYLRVEIAALGAELMSIYDRSAGTELLWNGDATYWKRRSPILFPNVVIYFLQFTGKLMSKDEQGQDAPQEP